MTTSTKPWVQKGEAIKLPIKMPDGEIITAEIPQWKTPWNHDTDLEARRTGTYNDEPSLTKQEFKEETDINVILERFMRGGDAPPPVLPEHFMDLTQRPTYFDVAQRIAEANKTFYMLDAETRAKHLNDPNRWADEVVQATNRGDKAALEALGIEVHLKPQEDAKATTSPAGGSPPPEIAKAPSEAPKGAPKTDSGN